MSASLVAVTIDCQDALVVGQFWSAALGRPIDPGGTAEFASIGFAEHRDREGWSVSPDTGPTWVFARVPEHKTAKNRMHVDLAAADHQTEVARLVQLGATLVSEMDEWGYRWTVLLDPEGNEFCVGQQH